MTDKIDEIKVMLETGEVLPFKEVKFYKGIFTGKMVKPSKIENDFEYFHKGDEVFVFNMEQFLKFYRGIELILEAIREIRTE